jgi:hypothetical protein
MAIPLGPVSPAKTLLLAPLAEPVARPPCPVPAETQGPAPSNRLLPLIIIGVLALLGVSALTVAVIALAVQPGQSKSSHRQAAAKDQADPPGKGAKKKGGPAKTDKGPAPARWTVLFRSDDPAVWNTNSPAPKFAVPLDQAPAAINYLRLKRMDTGAFMILPLNRGQLDRAEEPGRLQPYGWNGTAKAEYCALHLGITQTPRYRFPAPNGMPCVMPVGWDVYTGSGFCHKAFLNNQGQFYCWQGKEIPKTAFEIAVTADPLSAADKRFLLGGNH